MWEKTLPNNCPNSNAIDYEGNVFRIIQKNEPNTQDFIIYAELYPNNPRYKSLCPAYAISFFDTLDNAKKALAKNSSLGKYIAKYQLTKTDGMSNFNKSTGHINTWFYRNSSFNIFTPIEIKEFNED